MLALVTPRLKAPLPFLLTMACLATSLPTPPSAQAGVMLVCNTMCTGGTCTATAACSPGAPNTCSFIGEGIFAANMAVCTLGAVDGMAMGMATMGTPATCSVYFSNLCGATTMCTMGFFTTVVNTCVMNSADGLPVELLDFKVSAVTPPRHTPAPQDASARKLAAAGSQASGSGQR